MTKKYISPNIKIITFGKTDVITASGSSSYSSHSYSSENDARIVFDAESVPSFHEFDIYVDGKHVDSVSGGSKVTVYVTAGRHEYQVFHTNSYNDTSGWLEPVEAYFEAGEEYIQPYNLRQ